MARYPPWALFAASIMSLVHQGMSQEGATDSTHAIATVDIGYQVWTGFGAPDNLTNVRRRVSYAQVDGLAIIDGDIVYGTVDDLLEDVIEDDGNGDLSRRALNIRSPIRRWPYASLPYKFESEQSIPGANYDWLTPEEAKERKEMFEKAAKIWMEHLPCFEISNAGMSHFAPEAEPAYGVYIRWTQSENYWSPVGRALSQEASIMGLGTASLADYLHAIGHSIGLHHEHQRPDRDEYFELDCSKVGGDVPADCSADCKGWGCWFSKLKDPNIWNFEGPYDTGSITHVFEDFAARDPSEPPLSGISGATVTRKEKPSLSDVTRVRNMYEDLCAGHGICGNGIVEEGETCDDGPDGSDTCTPDCKLKTVEPCCGDGIIQDGEECDDGPDGSDTCTPGCKLKTVDPYCGDGIVDDGEECDDGSVGSDTCTPDCKLKTVEPCCGDGIIQDGEECDDGPDGSDTCTPDCKLKTVEPCCGDGIIQDGEECDDGPDGSDTCTSDCKLQPYCGDGIVDGDEECDDGLDGSDTCTSDCKLECYCGNLIVEEGEECDDGLEGSDSCTPDCKLLENSCGNFVAEGDEECDDGPDGSDVCTPSCKSVVCECGNYIVEDNEECDDGPAGSSLCTPDCKIISAAT